MVSKISFVLLICCSVVLADTRNEVDRLFMQASSGAIRYQSLVQPSKDSLIAMKDSAAKYLALKLNVTDAREKTTLVEIYKGIGAVATPYLLPALNTDNKDQLRTTCRCLAEVKDSAAIRDLLRVAGHQDFTIRSEALTAIGRTGGDDTLAMRVAEFYSDSIADVRKSCVVALGRIRSLLSLDLLSQALSDPHFAVRLTAFDALVGYDSLAAVQVTNLLESASTTQLRTLGIRLAGQMNLKGTETQLKNCVADSDPLVRGWAVWAWGRVAGTAADSILSEMLKSEDDLFVRSQLQQSIPYPKSQ